MSAIRDVVEPADRLTIVRTDSMVIITAGDGRTTRLAPDGSKIKDEASGIERKTHWEGEKLVSEISGLGRGKATQTFSVDPQTHQLVVVFDADAANGRKGDDSRTNADNDAGPRGGGPGATPRVPRRRVYDPLEP